MSEAISDDVIAAKLREVAKAFRIEGTYLAFEKIKIGNVNQTYRITYLQPPHCDPKGEHQTDFPKHFIVQRINTYAFRNPEQLMSNIDKVTEHIRAKNPGVIALHYHHLANRSNYFTDETGVWRLSNYIESVTFNKVPSKDALHSAGKAFGRFQNFLSDFDASLLYETIPDFHNTRKRLEWLWKAAESDPVGRKAEVLPELDYIKQVSEKACTLVDMQARGELPLRVTHNDTKINNVLFDKTTHKPLVIVDLDTVMPGLVGSDFGDAVRFACNTEEEDSRNYEKALLDMEMFRAFAEGFLSKTKYHLTPNEVKTLPLSVFSITVELASRFLTDYLKGDKYFTILYPEHNLVRTRCQLAFARDVDRHLDEMARIIAEC